MSNESNTGLKWQRFLEALIVIRASGLVQVSLCCIVAMRFPLALEFYGGFSVVQVIFFYFFFIRFFLSIYFSNSIYKSK